MGGGTSVVLGITVCDYYFEKLHNMLVILREKGRRRGGSGGFFWGGGGGRGVSFKTVLEARP